MLCLSVWFGLNSGLKIRLGRTAAPNIRRRESETYLKEALRSRIAGRFLCQFGLLAPLHHGKQQVDEHAEIYDEDADPQPGEAEHKLANLDGQERRGDEQGEIFAPGLFKIETDGFKEAEAGIAEGSRADAAQHVVIDHGSLINEEVDKARLGKMQVADKAGQEIVHVPADEPHCADAHDGEDEGDEQFVGRDKYKALVAAPWAARVLGV